MRNRRSGFIDQYVIRARVVPAFLGAAPGLALLASLVIWQPFSLPQAIASMAFLVLFWVFADIARRFGKAAEKQLFTTTNGQPFPTVLRTSDTTIDAVSKAKYVAFLAGKLGEAPPTIETDPTTADAFYSRCGQWLREQTRDQAKFKLVFEENVTYGFRRNLYGLKPVGLALNVSVVALAVILVVLGYSGAPQLTAVLAIAAMHACYFILAVSKRSVEEASNQYGRQLVLTCETLMKKSTAKKKATLDG